MVWENISVLYVEDDKNVRNLTIPFLQEFFPNVVPAENGEEALKLFKVHNFDLIITDINMPVMNGLKLIKEIRDINQKVPIIVISAYDDTDYIIDAIRYGVDGYILKPINLDQFISTVERVVEKINLERENQSLLNLLKQYQQAIDEFLIVSKTDRNGNITYVNKKFEKISGYSKEELIGKNHRIVKHPDMPKEFFKDMWNTITKGEKWSGIVKNKSKSGEAYYVDTVIFPIKDKQGNIVEYFSIRQDVSNIINPQKKLQLSLNPNKESIIAIVKITNFSYIEDLYSFDEVSKVEEQIKEVISNLLPKNCNIKDIINFSGGEYVLIREFEETPTRKFVNHIVKKLKELPKKIQDKSYETIEYDLIIKVSVAYGVDAYKMAKYGMRRIENSDEDFIVVNDIQEKIKEEANRNLTVLNKVKKAIKNNKVEVFFQPIINNKTGKPEKLESLVRIIDENGQILSPFSFLEIVKKTKLYTDLTKTIIFKSIKAHRILGKSISINLSYKDIENEEIREFIYKTIKKLRKSATNITFEIVETEEIKDYALIDGFIKKVKEYKVKIAIDDFGSGYSNFERLLSQKPDFVKIDGSLIKRIADDRTSLSLVEGIVEFCKKENLKTIAEFVEDENIFQIVKDLGVDYSQGYYFGKPEKLEFFLNGELING